MLRPTLVFFAMVLMVLATASVGAMFTGPGVRDWYPSLSKPTWTPPSWVFGPVWSALYLCIAIAGFLTWRRSGLAGAKGTWVLFGLQLIFNAGWSWIFFGLRQPGWAFAEIAVLWALILGTTIALFRISAAAGYLFVPYLIWVAFAAALNLEIWRLNGGGIAG